MDCKQPTCLTTVLELETQYSAVKYMIVYCGGKVTI